MLTSCTNSEINSDIETSAATTSVTTTNTESTAATTSVSTLHKSSEVTTASTAAEAKGITVASEPKTSSTGATNNNAISMQTTEQPTVLTFQDETDPKVIEFPLIPLY